MLCYMLCYMYMLYYMSTLSHVLIQTYNRFIYNLKDNCKHYILNKLSSIYFFYVSLNNLPRFTKLMMYSMHYSL